MITRVVVAAAVLLAPMAAHAQSEPAAFGVASAARVSTPAASVGDRETVNRGEPDWRTIRSPWLLAVDTHVAWLVDSRADVFNRNHPTVVGPGVSIARDIASLGARGALAIGLGYRHASTDGVVAQSIDTHLDSNSLVVDVAARTTWLSWLTPSVRLAGEAVRFDTVVASSSGHPLSGGTWSALGMLGVGLTAHTPATMFERTPSFMLGIKVEAGYQLGSPVSIGVAPPPPSDTPHANDRIAVQPTQIGTFIPQGPYLRISALVRF